MKSASTTAWRHGADTAARLAHRLARLALLVLVGGAVLFAGAWATGGDAAVSDNWVGVTVGAALFAGLIGAFGALVTAVIAGLRHEPWDRLWLPLATLPAVLLVVGLLEAFVFE